MIFVGTFCYYDLLNIARKPFLPKDVFYIRPFQWTYFVWFLFAIYIVPIAMFISNTIAWLIPPVRKIFDAQVEANGGMSYAEVQKPFKKWMCIASIVIAPFLLLDYTTFYYLTESGVSVRSLFKLKQKHYAWSDIVKVEAKCDKNLTFAYLLHFNDGFSVDLEHPSDHRQAKFTPVYNFVIRNLKKKSKAINETKLSAEALSSSSMNPQFEKYLEKIFNNEEIN